VTKGDPDSPENGGILRRTAPRGDLQELLAAVVAYRETLEVRLEDGTRWQSPLCWSWHLQKDSD
jgi:hypothetical protein